MDWEWSREVGWAQSRHGLDPTKHFLDAAPDSLAAREPWVLPFRFAQPVLPVLRRFKLGDQGNHSQGAHPDNTFLILVALVGGHGDRPRTHCDSSHPVQPTLPLP